MCNVDNRNSSTEFFLKLHDQAINNATLQIKNFENTQVLDTEIIDLKWGEI
jgi:hypothetical protein